MTSTEREPTPKCGALDPNVVGEKLADAIEQRDAKTVKEILLAIMRECYRDGFAAGQASRG